MNKTGSEQALRPGSYRLIALAIASALLMQQLDATVLAIAMPAMARDFGVPPAWLSVALTSYLVSLAIFIPASGHLADRWGARRVYCLAIMLFLLGSVGCAQTHGLGGLIATRMVQGLGGALMMPVGRLILIRCTPREELMAALAWLVIPALIGPILGPPLGGFIITWLDWRWIFYINLPVGVVGLAMAMLLVPPMGANEHPPFDGKGFLLSGAALGCLVFGLELSSRRWAMTAAIALVLFGLMFGWAYIVHARSRRAAILDLSLLRIPTFGLSVAAGNLSRIAQGALPFLLPLLLQMEFHKSALATGLISMATAVGALLMKPLAPAIIERFGYRAGFLTGSLAASLGYACLAGLNAATPLPILIALLAGIGFATSLLFTGYNTVAFLDLAPERMSSATSLYATVQQLSLSLGICMAGMILEMASGPAQDGQTGSSGAFSLAFLAMAAVSACGAGLNRRFPKPGVKRCDRPD